MKKLFTLALLLPTFAFGQSLVGTEAQLRTGLLEDFTGINCVNCPDGHAVMASVAAAAPGRVSLVGVHAGGFATPGAGQLDLRTPFGTSLNSFYGVNAYPTGMVNRRPYNGTLVMGRGSWASAMDAVLALPSPVNLGVESQYDASAQLLTVVVQAHYTADGTGGDDRISVLLTENHIIGYQSGGSANYDHKHVLRTYLTELWGDPMGASTAGSSVERTYTFPVPAGWNMDNCEVTAFVSEHQGEVYQARTVAAVGGTTLITGLLAEDAAPYRSGTPGQPTDFQMDLTNALGAEGEFLITLSAPNAPASWSSALTVDGSPFTSNTSTTLADAANAQVEVQITPDNTPGIGHYRLTIAAVAHPTAPVLQQDLHVISGVHDLIVTNPQAEPWDALYTAAMDQAGELAYARTNRDQFIRFGEANALGDVLNVYRNVSWTFPSITDAEVAVLTAFMDNGGNLMIAGQDIGWDQSGDANAYGTATTQAFYQNYLLADFVNDGSPSNSQVRFNVDDPVFGDVPNSNVAHVFGSGFTYPDEIIPIAPAVPILTYNATPKIGALRAETSAYKLVYFGIGPEQMGTAAVGRQMIQLSHDWFYGTVGIAEFDAAIGNLGQAYPVPADDLLTIPVSGLRSDAVLELFDALGRKVMEQPLGQQAGLVRLNTTELGNGVYSYRLRTATSSGPGRSFVVAH